MNYLLINDDVLTAIDMEFKSSCNVYDTRFKAFRKKEKFISTDNMYELEIQELEIDGLYTVDFFEYGKVLRKMVFGIITSDYKELLSALTKIDYRTRRIFISNLLEEYESVH